MGKSQEKRSRGDEIELGEDAVISAKGAARARAGHLWIFRSDCLSSPGAKSGAVVRVVDKRRRFVAFAHYSEESEISLRLLSNKDEAIDRDFWRTRLRTAAGWRDRVVSDTTA
jgi:23S rRNA (cytosine1962-C5)-methyltransferase